MPKFSALPNAGISDPSISAALAFLQHSHWLILSSLRILVLCPKFVTRSKFVQHKVFKASPPHRIARRLCSLYLPLPLSRQLANLRPSFPLPPFTSPTSPILGPSLNEKLTEADHQGVIENTDREANERLSRAAFAKHHGYLYAKTPHGSEVSEVEPASSAGTPEGVQASSVASRGVIPSFVFRSTSTEEDLLPPKARNNLHRTRAKQIAKAPRHQSVGPMCGTNL
jgi:hypothetical protein